MNIKKTLIKKLKAVYAIMYKYYCFASYMKYKVHRPKLNKDKYLKNVTVSFTTYPQRVRWLPIVVGSIMRQSVHPERVVLYLSKEQFPRTDIKELEIIRKQGVDIKYKDDDLKSHKKYYYAMLEYPEDVIITIDDDTIYGKDMIKRLYESYLRHPNAVSATRAHLMKFQQDGTLKPYKEWENDYQKLLDTESKLLFPTGCGGVLYPPNCLNRELFNVGKIKELCFFADDVWLKIMELLCDTPVVCVKQKKNMLIPIWNTTSDGLAKNNVKSTGNDDQISNVCNGYNLNIYDLCYGK